MPSCFMLHALCSFGLCFPILLPQNISAAGKHNTHRIKMSAWGQGSTLRSCDSLLRRVEENDATLVNLVILPIKTFASDDVVRLASAIRSNLTSASGGGSNLRTINASGHAVSPQYLEVLGSAIGCSSSSDGGGEIISLAIGDQTMRDDGIVALCRGIYQSKSSGGPPLQILDLSFKGAADGAMEAVGNCFADSTRLQRLDLSRNEGIGDSGVEALCDAAAATCACTPSRRGGDADAAATSTSTSAFPNLCQLNLSQCNIGPAGAHALASLLLAQQQNEQDGSSDNTSRSRLELVLNSNPIDRSGCVAMGSLLNAPTVSGRGWSFLSSLSLADCNIDDDDIRALIGAAKDGGCSGLIMLDLSRNQITKTGADVLSNALATKSGGSGSDTSLLTLKELRMPYNDIGAEGVISLASSLVQRHQKEEEGAGQLASPGSNCTLSVLDLCKTNCGAEGAVAALKCGGLSLLRLFGNRILSEGLEAITPLLRGGHPSLVELDIGGNDAKEDAVENLIREISVVDNEYESALRVLELGGNEVGERFESALKDLKLVKPELDVAHDKPKTTNATQSWENA